MLRAVAVVLAAVLAAPAVVEAHRITVVPGPGTPVQDAIDAASPGDTIRLTDGTYPEHVVISKPLRISGHNATIDGGCDADTAVEIAADAVSLSRLTIVGGNFYALDTTARDRSVLEKLVIRPTCPNVQYGINVFQGTNVRIRSNTIQDTSGFGDAGIYIGGTPADADLRVERNVVDAPSERGIIVEDSLDTPGGAIGVRVRKNAITGCGTGIWVFGSNGVDVSDNQVTDSTAAGIELTSGSDSNILTGNRLSGNNPDVLDNGADNCWRRNQYATGTVPPC